MLSRLARFAPRASAAFQPAAAAAARASAFGARFVQARMSSDIAAEDNIYYSKVFVSKPAPHFSTTAVVNEEFKEVSLSDYKGKYLVLFFYPLDFTFVCPTEICDFSDRVEEFRKIGCEVVACSVDSKFSHLAWIQTPRNKGGLGKMNIPILADLSKSIARDYGVLMNEEHTARGTFIIDGNGKVRQFSVNEPPVGRNVDEVLRLVKGYQFNDKNGEVCPSGWTPGAKTIKTHPTKKLEYFAEVNK